MRCKVGDLCVVVRSVAGNEGKVITCVRYLGLVPGWRWNDYWQVDRDLATFDYKTGALCEPAPYIRDSYLRPLRPDAGEDETLSWASVPRTERDSIPAEALDQMKKEEV